MSSAFPILFKPVIIGNKCYIDGGVLNNFPLGDCLTQTKCDSSEILAFKNNYENNYEKDYITENSSLFYFIYMFVKSLARTSEISLKKDYNIENIVQCENKRIGYENWANILIKKENRIEYIKKGTEYGETFLMNYKKS